MFLYVITIVKNWLLAKGYLPLPDNSTSMHKFVITIVFFVCGLACQDFGKLHIEQSLPSILEEISGIEKIPGSHLLWAIADSNNSAEAYGYNPVTNKIEKTVVISNGANIDWEDMASDAHGNLYIGDFGNNQNDRKDQVIYTIPNKDLLGGGSSEALKTTFTFEDQAKYPPNKKARNFDVEAFIFLNNNFYLFTRNRSTHFDGTVKLYRLPAKPGHFEARLINTFIPCKDEKDCQITAATIDHATGQIALLSYNKVWLLSNYTGDNFFNGLIRKIKLGHSSQKESICFKNSGVLYIADEGRRNVAGNLYTLKIN